MEEKFTFAGQPLRVKILSDDAIIQCKGVIGTYKNIVKFLDNSMMHNNFNVTGEDCPISLTPDGKIVIGCLEEDIKTFNKKLSKIKKLIKEKSYASN